VIVSPSSFALLYLFLKHCRFQQVLDARDPMGTRSLAVEAAVTANPDKKLVLVLNKVPIFIGDTTKEYS